MRFGYQIILMGNSEHRPESGYIDLFMLGVAQNKVFGVSLQKGEEILKRKKDN